MTKRAFRLLLQSTIATVIVVFGKSDFEPYQLNGGLVSAVAGRNYCIVASDTRLMDGGYEIYTRQHTSSRLWCVHPNHHHHNLLAAKKSDSLDDQTTLDTIPVWIASAGCNADCEALKRAIQHESLAFLHHQGSSSSMTCAQAATLLSQVLYRRRSFPFYSFCVVSGISKQEEEEEHGHGEAYQYDAIGSYEQVAVATSGTGRELLQPILDRMFFSSKDKESEESMQGFLKRPTKAVPTIVECSCEQAIEILIGAYQSVTEREIGVGDSLVLMVTQINKNGKNGNDECTVQRIQVPLKRH